MDREKNEIENKNTEIEEDIKEEELPQKTEEIITETEELVPLAEDAGITETQEEEVMPVAQEPAEENSVNVQDKDKTENNTESSSLPEEDIKKAKVPGTEKKPVVKAEKTRPANYSSNRPKKFVVTNEPSAAKRDKSSSLPENKRDRSINRASSKSSPDNSRKISRNNNSASNSRGIRDGSSLNRKSDSINKRKSNYNSTINRNNAAVKDSNRNSKK
ncbi:MAG: hypothetical protein K2K35_02015 [Lachnospiraceae bacterium]|nr:hypothetical protein [Lachnospiraceae bacterium]